jgi:hypothetical protein
MVLASGTAASIATFSTFGWFLTTHRKHDTAAERVGVPPLEKHDEPKPDHSRPSIKKPSSDERLINNALELAGRIRKLHQDWLSERTKIDNAPDVTEPQRTSMRAVWANKVMAEYDSKYKVDARLIHDKLLARLPGGSDNLVSNDLYTSEVNPGLLEIIADNIEHLGKLLRDSKSRRQS